jgi:hypothetical protein
MAIVAAADDGDMRAALDRNICFLRYRRTCR